MCAGRRCEDDSARSTCTQKHTHIQLENKYVANACDLSHSPIKSDSSWKAITVKKRGKSYVEKYRTSSRKEASRAIFLLNVLFIMLHLKNMLDGGARRCEGSRPYRLDDGRGSGGGAWGGRLNGKVTSQQEPSGLAAGREDETSASKNGSRREGQRPSDDRTLWWRVELRIHSSNKCKKERKEITWCDKAFAATLNILSSVSQPFLSHCTEALCCHLGGGDSVSSYNVKLTFLRDNCLHFVIVRGHIKMKLNVSEWPKTAKCRVNVIQCH